MIITLFIYNLSGGGAERVICNLANYLVNSKCKINILTVVKGEQAYSLDARIKIDSLSEEKELSSSLQNYRLWTKRLKDYNSMYKPDCYIAMLLIPIKLILGFLLAFSIKNFPFPIPNSTYKGWHLENKC